MCKKDYNGRIGLYIYDREGNHNASFFIDVGRTWAGTLSRN